MKDRILNQFDENKWLYEKFWEKCKDILLELTKDNKIWIHYINSRIKERDSLCRKIDARIDKYSTLSDITDICGIRIITYLDSDVNKVAEIIENEFLVDTDNSIDKRKHDSDKFGYMSLHYVVWLNNQRGTITENIKFKWLKLEIQVRSILQHAWAEIEHDLGYKWQFAIPEHFKRNFNRLAALLETADIEFNRLKQELWIYEKQVWDDIKEMPNEVLINQASLLSFNMNCEIFEIARKIIQQNSGCTFYEKIDLQGELERFELFNIKTIGELDDLISQNKKHYLSYVDNMSKNIRENTLINTLPLFYFQHFLACKSNSIEFIDKYFDYGSKRIWGKGSTQDFLDIYNNSQ